MKCGGKNNKKKPLPQLQTSLKFHFFRGEGRGSTRFIPRWGNNINNTIKEPLIITEIINKPLGEEGESSCGALGGLGSAWGPPSSRLLLQPQQAVGNALLVARQAHPDPLDVPGKMGKEEKSQDWWSHEPGMGLSQQWPYPKFGGPQKQRLWGGDGWVDTAHPEGWMHGWMDLWTWLIPRDGQTDMAHPEGWMDGSMDVAHPEGWMNTARLKRQMDRHNSSQPVWPRNI